MQRFIASAPAESLGDREIGVIASTDELARDGNIVIPAGIDLTAYRKNPVVLFSHDITRPVGVCTAVGVEDGALAARIQFAPQGVSQDADYICNLTKGGILKGISIGFLPTESEPIDPKQAWAGQRITSCDLLEISVVSVPADTGASVISRGFAQIPGAMQLIRSLIPTSPAARQRVADRFRQPARKPVGVMSDFERAAHYVEQQRVRTLSVWAAGQARDAEHAFRWSRESRQRRVAELEAEQLRLEGTYRQH